MKVLLTGGSGFLGSWIARILYDSGYTIRLLLRNQSNKAGLSGIRYESCIGDLCDVDSLVRATNGVDVVIHAAGNVSVKPKDKSDIYTVNVAGTRNLYKAAIKNRISRFIYTSTCGTVGATDKPVLLNEDAHWDLGNHGYHYIDSKRIAEETVFSYGEEYGIDTIVLLPGWMFGPGDSYLTSNRFMLEFIQEKLPFYFSGGMSYCDVRDVAKAHVTAITRAKPGERYLLTGHNLSYKQLMENIKKITGMGKIRAIPYPLLYLIATVAELTSYMVSHCYEELSRAFVYMSKKYFYFDMTKAAVALNYENIPFEKTIHDTVNDFRKRHLIS